MVSGTRSSFRGRGRGRGRGRAISVHESVHGGPIQGDHASVHQIEDRDVHVSEHQEEDHNEHHADSEEVDLRQMMRTIMDRLPPIQDQNRGHRAEHEHRPRSRTPPRDRHRSIVSSQMKDLQRSKLKPFNGQGSGYVADQWLIALDRIFAMQDFDSNVKARFAITHLENFGANWWNIEEKKLGLSMSSVTWELFLESFRERFLPEEWKQHRSDEFHDLRQCTLTVTEYERKFFELMPFSGFSDNPTQLAQHFIRGLNNRLAGGVKVFEPKTLKEAVHRAILVEQSVNLGHGGFVGAPSASGSKGGQGAGGNRKPPSGGNRRQEGAYPPAQSGGGGSNARNYHNAQRNKSNQYDRPSQSVQSYPSGGSFQQSSAPGVQRSFNGECFSCGQRGHKSSRCPQGKPQFSGQRPATSEPTVGDMGRAQRVFSVESYPPTGGKGSMGPA